MKQQNIFFVGLLILLIIIGFGFILYQSQPKTATNEDIVMTKNKEAGIGGQESGGKILAGKSSPYIEFKKGEYDEALKSGKIIFLDFYANWCPICRGEAPEIQSGFDSLTSDKVIGFRVNYNDTETDDDEKKLAEDFGVTYQHTKVILKDKKEVLKDGEVWDKEKFLEEINKYL
ncbi:hypothetical protein A3C28_02785 [Candidatus Roizmanbacteria bacterium RIFCSPHIGHO2_02_FULL_39_9]|uniref:Thioredoxin domain-containing protein n=3 Tax=Candidatus Roizmaniibacteriota TaxID=1752723 RepID=A0A1F7I0H9_9BACT|nr:MAG: hypothetical protein A3C28_02785 [Candidatus Roizmanbacteria bacterium RIFCSPHIGHO2_02_FULL_39_9]OGK36732.1 MAG: hypothetical protein A3F60_02995 [Candidatus Roizmanbacteria bacterium RIFCSPHIGHO2_12_FULL_39_8]